MALVETKEINNASKSPFAVVCIFSLVDNLHLNEEET
jgi:hypothetical protein